jgi:hypothetical protein
MIAPRTCRGCKRSEQTVLTILLCSHRDTLVASRSDLQELVRVKKTPCGPIRPCRAPSLSPPLPVQASRWLSRLAAKPDQYKALRSVRVPILP